MTTPPPLHAPVPYVCPLGCAPDPLGAEAHNRTHHPLGVPHVPEASPDLVRILAEYFTGPDLALCSLAMAADPETTARKRADRFFQARDAFGIPRECDLPTHARDYIINALSKFAVH